MDAPKTKTVTLCGVTMTLTLDDCRRCGEQTWFTGLARTCNACASEFIDITGGSAERGSVRTADMEYQGSIPDKTEEAGQPQRHADD